MTETTETETTDAETTDAERTDFREVTAMGPVSAVTNLMADSGYRVEILEFHPRTCQNRTIRPALQLRQHLVIMLVFDIADNLFNDILDGHQPIGAAIFINDNRTIR